MNIRIIALIGFLIISGNLAAQEASLRLTLNRNSLNTGDLLQVSYSLNGKGSKWKLPAFNDWMVVSGPNVSTSFQSINGQSSMTTTYTYLLQPTKTGKFTIPAASVEVDGKILTSNTAEVTVGGTAQPKEEKKADEEIFLRITADKSKAVIGEQITITYRIYTRIPVRSYSLQKVPSWSGFWAQDIEQPNQISLSTEYINGVAYQTGVLRVQALFAQKKGSFNFDPVEMETIVRKTVRTGDPFFDDPFFGMSREMQVKLISNRLKIEVVDFPAAPPQNFSGISGKLNMSSTLSANKTKANEPVTLKITVSGDGNIKMIPDFKLKLPAEIESYDPKVTEQSSKSGTKVSGTKTYEYLLIPRTKGNYKIDPQQLVYFNLDNRRFVTLSTPEYLLSVEKGDDNAIAGPVVTDKKEIDLLTRDLRFIKLQPLGNKSSGKGQGNSGLALLGALPFLLGFGAFAFYRYRENEARGGMALRQSRASAMVRRRLKKAEKHLKNNSRAEFYTELSAAIWEYLRDKLKMHNAELTRDIVEERIKIEAAREPLQSLWSALADCELARYAPSSPGLNEQDAYEKVAAAIKELEARL